MVKLNGDVGESFGPWQMGQDELLIPVLDMANIACGFHASDPDVMVRTIDLCLQYKVTIGAHPGYADKEGFGRRSIPMARDALIHSVLYQIGALQSLAGYRGGSVSYFKPHGALYNDMRVSQEVLSAMFTVSAVSGLPVMMLATADAEQHLERATKMGASLLFEAFADRRYLSSGLLAPRSLSGSVLHEEHSILSQAKTIIKHQPLKTLDNGVVQLTADTLCVHGDNLASISVAKAIKALLQNEG
ncbi:5-oxoprolinase subunit PxpA [Vibrio hangzhouensis]|uniref:5-oxoprolinase subunit PxpA n=1 Tax=Vibrio hangzhouensis TaxID=462991 RepID=UPI001C96F190|nr:5-oxoprolinase subunit PxpA [Vibrio hangzhouensis]MBY6197607.1 5-oxoprolinase subunit PxpA [Vibrio hangzhouensis]